ncbi:hypothetical protein [Halosimplex pelagicum]|uniref:Uncharacterized protein n=1 Tax=Halosimplex pelagicum TaxID=869886 RepID=A0A7D5P8I8_9EURY|nr:hypothetical protein [Halosimplex pelagicum]QLH83383.1 hypothetical protein HZS54_17865 [Halosimplex pelagicum]
MSSRRESSKLESSKAIGDSVEAVVINAEPRLEAVGDSVATWHDAVTLKCLSPSYERPIYAIPVVDSGVETEIKGAAVVRSNGTRQSPGHWYIKRGAHEKLKDAGGVYLLAVYGLRESTPILRSVIIPATVLDDVLEGRWYEVDIEGRSEKEVVQLTWTTLIDRERVPAPAEVSR